MGSNPPNGKRKVSASTGAELQSHLRSPSFANSQSRPVENDKYFDLFAKEPDDASRLRFIGSSIGPYQRNRISLPDSFRLTWPEKYPRRAEWLEQNGYTMEDAVNANEEWNAEILDASSAPPVKIKVSGPDIDEIAAAARRFKATASKAEIEAAPKLHSVDLRALLILAELISHGTNEVEWASVAAILNKEWDDALRVNRAKDVMVANGFLTEIGKPHKIAKRFWFRIEPCVAQEARRIWNLLLPVDSFLDDGPVPDGFRWNGTNFYGLKGKAWLLTEYLWGRRGKVVNDTDLADGSVWEDASDVTENSLGSVRRAANEFFKSNGIPLRIETRNHCRHVFLKG